jgi:transglutaminase-like putative cysteine protease
MKFFGRSLSGRNARPMSRDKADTLLLLFACVLVLAPHTAHVPLWVTGIGIALLLWRGWITFRGNRLPPRWLLLPIAAAAMGGVYLTFKTILGQDAGVAMLTLLLVFKLLEMHAKRDLFVVVFLGFFLMLANFFYSQSIATAVLMIAAVIVMVTAQLSFQYIGAIPPFGRRLRSGALIVALAIPLTLVLFVLFPRIQGPLWGMPSDANAGRSGLSDRMTPGNIAKLALSNEIAFRAKFIDPVPLNPKLYWRAIVLDQYDGRTWTRHPSQRDVSGPATLAVRGTPVRYQITQEPGSQPWLFALDMPQTAPQLNDNPVRLTQDRQLVSRRPIDSRVRYDVVSYPDYTLQEDAHPDDLQNWLALPSGYNPRTLQFAANLRKNIHDDAAKIAAVLTFFGDKNYNFIYTLEPPLLGRNSVDEFLFVSHAGFCEHYAGAFVVLMRAMGVPARVVTGYQGGEINPVDGFLTVRQSDAHAWAEVWIVQRGWVRVDPTAAVSPDRVQRSVAVAAPTEPVFGGLINLNIGQDSVFGKLRFRWDAINNSWNQWVLNYTPERQKSLLRSLGFDNINWQTMTLLMCAIGAIVMLVIAVPLLADRRKIDPVDAVYAAFCRQMARRGHPRHAHEGPRGYARRLIGGDVALTQEKKHALRNFLALYEQSRYGRPASTRSDVLSKLKSLLNQIR